MSFLWFFLSICNAFVVWQEAYSNQIVRCELVTMFGNGTIFVDLENRSIVEFVMQTNFTFGIVPSPQTNLNTMYVVACVDLTSGVCSDYTGPCPKSVFLISIAETPFVSVTNYRKAFSKYNITHDKLTLYLNFLS